jgi:hypothetical protein
MDTVVSFKEEKLCKELRKSIVDYGSLIYVKHIFVNTIYTSNPNKKTSQNGRLNELFEFKLSEFKSCMEQGEYQEIVCLIERPWRLKWVYENRELILSNMGVEGFYEIFADAYNDTENACQFKDEVLEMIYLGGNPHLMMERNELKQYKKLPSEIKIFRGVCLNKKDDVYDFIGSSWTLDYEKAKWFAERRGFNENEYPLVYSITVNKEDVLSYFTRRDESEILIDYSKIDLDELEFLYPNEIKNPVLI